jgi:hypothetical protein
MDTHATVSEFDLKTWGFLLYPHRDSDSIFDFNALLQQILRLRILPIAQHYFHRATSPLVDQPLGLLSMFLGLRQGTAAGFCLKLDAKRMPHWNLS